MTKTVPESKFTELKGIDRISTTVHGMKCLFREITKSDFGIDGEIEVVTPKADGNGYEVTGGIIKVQAKSGDSYVKQDTVDSFSTPVTKADIESWHAATFPVIFIVYHPKDDKLYWKDIRAYVRDTPQILFPPIKIIFDKRADEFSVESMTQVRTLADVSPPRVSLEEREKLYSNLLLVERLPPILSYAATLLRTNEEVRGAIDRPPPPFCVMDGRLYTLGDLRDKNNVLRDVVQSSQINDALFPPWLEDNVLRGNALYLLNQLLGQHLWSCGLRYNRHFKRNYFPRENDEQKEFKKDWKNIRTGRKVPGRLVVKYYEYGIDAFWRHLAAKFTWREFGGSWYLQVTPQYLFTSDGKEPYDRVKIGPYTTSLKAMEHNPNVLNHVLFFADVLAHGTNQIDLRLAGRPTMRLRKEPVSGIAPFAIPYDPAVFEDVDEEESQSNMFRLLGLNVDDEEEQEPKEDGDELED